MAKEWKSLWGDYDDDGNGPDEAKKPAGSASDNEKRVDADSRYNEDEKDRTTIGFNTSYDTDDRYGYTGASGYGYYDSFDDSDADWYRRSSFRYGRSADYSPSSQFRSTFSGRYASYTYSNATDEAKNKAIRALRNLSRSANTIIDKTGTNKQGFAVQFSNGADSNGLTDHLNEEKQRVVFVSPDELLETKTTEEEDAVVDALTGFVLLRVQIAQDVTADTIKRINYTSLQAAGFRAADCLFLNKDKLAGISPKSFGQATTDDYLAGLLAKSMLTRLARRGVVSNWGGFAPYFVRHAKKFAGVREHLEKAEKSVESVVSTIGYNMLADEDQIELPKEINDIVAKHLGTAVENNVLLDKCRELVADVRAFLETTSATGEAPAGEIEQALEEMMSKAQAEQAAASSGAEGFKDFLDAAGSMMGEASEAGRNAALEHDIAALGDSAVASDIKAAISVEQLMKQLEWAHKEMDRAKDSIDNARSAEAISIAAHIKTQMTYHMTSRPSASEALESAGVAEAKDLLKELMRRDTFDTIATTPATKESIDKLAAAVDSLMEKAAALLKKQKTALKHQALSRMSAMVDRTEKAHQRIAELQEKIDATAAAMAAMPTTGSLTEAEKAAGTSAMDTLNHMADSFKHRLQQSRTAIPPQIETMKGARSLATISKAFAAAQNATHNSFASAGHCFYNNYSLHTSPALGRISKELSDTLDGETPTEDAVRAAVENALISTSVTDTSFMASLINAFMKDVLTQLSTTTGDERKAEADKLGVSVETLNKLIRAFENINSAGKSTPSASKLGEKVSAALEAAQVKFSPVDRQLFGEKIDAKTTILTGAAIGHVNDEARNAAEEEYVAYLNGNETKPKVVTRREGDHGGRHYRENRVTVIQEVRKKNRGAIESIKNALQFQSGLRTIETHGLRSGDLDEGSLHKLGYDCENIWSQKTISKLPDVAVGILVDQSGSMSGSKITQAREICITLAEAIRKITGVRLYVYGHTANMSGMDVTIYEHYAPSMGADLTQLGGITAHCNNYDGYAIKDVAKRLSTDPAKKKYLFVIADGLPSASGYGGESAAKHVTSVCKYSRDRLKIGTYAFAVGVHGHSQNAFKRQYGDNHVVFVDNVMKCLPQIVRFLRNAMQQERKLVGVEN